MTLLAPREPAVQASWRIVAHFGGSDFLPVAYATRVAALVACIIGVALIVAFVCAATWVAIVCCLEITKLAQPVLIEVILCQVEFARCARAPVACWADGATVASAAGGSKRRRPLWSSNHFTRVSNPVLLRLNLSRSLGLRNRRLLNFSLPSFLLPLLDLSQVKGNAAVAAAAAALVSALLLNPSGPLARHWRLSLGQRAILTGRSPVQSAPKATTNRTILKLTAK